MDNVKALEIVKYCHEIRVNFHKKMFNDNIRPEAREEVEAEKLAIAALEKQVAVPVLVRRRDGYIRPDYYCPVCNKQQKDSFKNRRAGCFCERCGQRLTF
jgi:hypothetical protein